MRLFRTILFWCHLATGVTVGVVVLIMSVTGVLLTYEKQMLARANTRAYRVVPPAPGAPRLAPDALVARVRQAEAGEPTAVTWRAGASRPVEVAFGREKTVFADPYTGAVLGQGAVRTRAFFRRVTDWHRWLAAKAEHRDRARSITGAANLGFLFLVLSGIFLWWPRNWSRRALRNATWFRRGLRSRARDFNWHNVIGFWSFVPLAVIVASAVVISYPWASNLVYRAMGEAPPPPQTPPGGAPGGARGGRGDEAKPAVEALLAGTGPLAVAAQAKVPGWRSITLQVPKAADAPVVFTIDRGSGGQPQKRASLTLERGTGREVKWEPFAAGTPGRRLRSVLRFAHTGEVLGIPGQTVAGVVSAGAALLVWTGLWLSFRRLRSWLHRRARFGPHGERRAAAGEAARAA
jgi:uncharacterized iron-regulated membrane protein